MAGGKGGMSFHGMDFSVLGIVASLLFIVVLALRGWHIILIAPMAVIVTALFSGMEIVPLLTGPYMKGFVNYASKFYLVFLAASIFGKVMEDSGAARSIALGILKLIGRGSQYNVLLAVAAITLALTFGGVSLFVVIFAVIPIARPLFRELNVPWHLFIAAFMFGMGSITMTMIPGTPSIINIMPTKYMASSTVSAPVLGLLGAVVLVVFNLWYLRIALRRAVEKGEGFHAHAGIPETEGQPQEVPLVWLCLLPPATLIVLLNVVKLDVLVAMTAATGVCIALFWTRYANLLETLNRGAVNTVVPIVNTCADVGYGMSIAATTGFQSVSAWLLSLPGHPIISLSIATNIMAAISGSASGGLGIIMETIVPKYLALGLSPDLVHRISVMSAGAFDALPHNGVVITSLAVTGLTHSNAYRHIWWGHVVATTIALLLVIPVGILLYR
ncbi:MAG: GntP family permease [Candidatus Solibacter usitatus]|nr:GntP family permease [Candidatus Solibacter usitatus]